VRRPRALWPSTSGTRTGWPASTSVRRATIAGSEGAGKVNVQDLSILFSADNGGQPPGKQIGGGGDE
jgi:hypothetical protein